MSEQKPKIAVVGASGRTGRHTVRQLLAAGYEVRALARSRDSIEPEITDFKPIDIRQDSSERLAETLSGCQVVICATGAKPPFDPAALAEVEVTGIKKLVDAARSVGITQFILVTSIGTTRPETIPFLSEILKLKRQAEQYLEQSGLTYTIVRPGGLTDEPGGQLVRVGRGDQSTGRLSREDVAAVLVQAVIQPAARHQIIEIVGGPEGKWPADPAFFA